MWLQPLELGVNLERGSEKNTAERQLRSSSFFRLCASATGRLQRCVSGHTGRKTGLISNRNDEVL